MKNSLLFDFTVNKENNTVHVQREFAAERALVWDAWTNPEVLDQWWAPKPYQTKTKSMDFRVGGYWLYAMVGPKNDTHWCRNDYQAIDANNSFSGLDAFCDESGAVNTKLPRTLWNTSFKDAGENTIVNITAKYNSLADLETVIRMGFKEGFTMALENLDQYFEAKAKLSE